MTSKQLEALEYLVDKARSITMTPEQTAVQRKSFAYGNSAFENANITRDIVEEEAKKIGL